MTLQNLNRILDKYELQLGSTNVQQFELRKELPFYNWHRQPQLLPSGNCGLQKLRSRNFGHNFNTEIGLPQKNGQSYPLFDYEQILFDTLQQHKHVWIKKATGLGVTEFMLRYMAWMCMNSGSNDSNKHAQEILKMELILKILGRCTDVHCNRTPH